MAATLEHKITSVLTRDLLVAGDGINSAKSITVSNVDGSNDASVDLFLNKSNIDYYILKNVIIPQGVTLALGPQDNIAFDNSLNGFSLRIKVDNGSTTAVNVDVIIKR
jgi:hypothetical protein